MLVVCRECDCGTMQTIARGHRSSRSLNQTQGEPTSGRSIAAMTATADRRAPGPCHGDGGRRDRTIRTDTADRRAPGPCHGSPALVRCAHWLGPRERGGDVLDVELVAHVLARATRAGRRFGRRAASLVDPVRLRVGVTREWRNLADAQDSGSCVRKDVGVQVPPRAPGTGCICCFPLLFAALTEPPEPGQHCPRPRKLGLRSLEGAGNLLHHGYQRLVGEHLLGRGQFR